MLAMDTYEERNMIVCFGMMQPVSEQIASEETWENLVFERFAFINIIANINFMNKGLTYMAPL